MTKGLKGHFFRLASFKKPGTKLTYRQLQVLVNITITGYIAIQKEDGSQALKTPA